MNHFMEVSLFWIGLNPTDRGCWRLTSSRLKHCQKWFLKIIFHVSKSASSVLTERLAGVNSVQSEIEYRKLLFIGRLFSVPNVAVMHQSIPITNIPPGLTPGEFF